MRWVWCQVWVLMASVVASGQAAAYSANKVWFEFRPGALYRVYVNYTVPELKEFREAYIEFHKKKEAERYYWDLLKGADFFPPDPQTRRFSKPQMTPDPW